MSVSPGDIVRITINGSLADGTKVMNRKTFRADFASPQSDANVITALKSWVETLYAYKSIELGQLC